jgi:outer membrane lipoprotein-sorting protein
MLVAIFENAYKTTMGAKNHRKNYKPALLLNLNMKKKFKVLFGVILFLLIVFVLVGCQQRVNSNELIQKVIDKLNNVESYHFTQNTNTNLKLNPILGSEQPTQQSTVSIDTKVDILNNKMHGITRGTTKSGSITATQTTEAYVINGKQFYKVTMEPTQVVSNDWQTADLNFKINNLILTIIKELSELKDVSVSTSNIDGKEVYVLKSKITQSQNEIETDSDIVYYISQDTYLPLSIEYKTKEESKKTGSADTSSSITFKIFNSDLDIQLPDDIKISFFAP